MGIQMCSFQCPPPSEPTGAELRWSPEDLLRPADAACDHSGSRVQEEGPGLPGCELGGNPRIKESMGSESWHIGGPVYTVCLQRQGSPLLMTFPSHTNAVHVLFLSWMLSYNGGGNDSRPLSSADVLPKPCPCLFHGQRSCAAAHSHSPTVHMSNTRPPQI